MKEALKEDYKQLIENHKKSILEELSNSRVWQTKFSVLNKTVEAEQKSSAFSSGDYILAAAVALEGLVKEHKVEKAYFKIKDTPHSRNGLLWPHYKLAGSEVYLI